MMDLTRRSLNRVYDYALEALCYGATEQNLRDEITTAIAEAKRHAGEVNAGVSE